MSEEQRTDGLCCGNQGGHDHGPMGESGDPGSQSLADALRISFKLLAAIMVLMVIGFALTGLQGIESNEVGLVKVFGRVTRVATPGLTYNWPFPIGQIEIVQTDVQDITLRDFWISEMPNEVEITDLSRRQVQSEGLRPGWDGALLTGDRYLIHMRIKCYYKVTDARAYRKAVRDKYVQNLPGKMGKRPVDPKEEMVRSAVCSSAIIAAATRTADALKNKQKDAFAKDVMREANILLAGEDETDATGLTITQITLPDTTWPLRALPDYAAVTFAKTKAETALHNARNAAETVLGKAVGQVYVQLVGKPWGTSGEADERALARTENRNYDLIGQYSQARDAGDEAGAKALLEKIDAVLLSNAIGGQVSEIIGEARNYAQRTSQQAKARLKEYEYLLPEYKRAPELTIQRLWASAREDILAAAMEKYYISKGKGLTVLQINRDPEVVKQQKIEKLRADREAREKKAKQQP